MPHKNKPIIFESEDVGFVLEALDSFIEHHRKVDEDSDTTDVQASAAIRRAADTRHQLEEDLLLDQTEAVRRAADIGSTVLNGMASDELAEAFRIYQATLPTESEEAKRADYLAQQLES